MKTDFEQPRRCINIQGCHHRFRPSIECCRQTQQHGHLTDKASVLTELASKLKLNKLMVDFLAVTARNGRAGDLKNILRAFKALAAKRRGTSSADVISADPLTATQLKELKTALKTALGRDVEIRTEVREDIIGGLIVKVGSRMFDSSLKTKLEGLRKTMKEA